MGFLPDRVGHRLMLFAALGVLLIDCLGDSQARAIGESQSLGCEKPSAGERPTE